MGSRSFRWASAPAEALLAADASTLDVHAATRHRTTVDLESLGRRHARFEFSLHDLHDRLVGAEWWDDQDFVDYGLSPEQVEDLRTWALAWVGDLVTRLHAGQDPHED